MLSLKETGAVPQTSRLRRVSRITARFLLLLPLTLGLQFSAGAYSSEFGLEPDEASHYITGLMVRDYITGGFPSPPLRYAEDYYLHYPRVAFGHYPPMFYIVQAAWTLALGVSRTSIMLLMAVLTTLLALLVDAVISRDHGTIAGIALAWLILLTPETQRAASSVMAESLLALGSFAALIYFARYLRSGLWRDVAGFATFSAVAILTKGLGLALMVVPAVAALASRWRHQFRKPAFWIPSLLLITACAPLFLFLPATGLRAFSRSQGFQFAPWKAVTLLPYEIGELGIVAALLIAAGVILWLRDLAYGKPDAMQTVAGAALAGFLAMRTFIFAASDARHAVMVAAPLAIFMASGAAWVAGRLRESRLAPFATTWLVLLCAIAVFLLTAFQVPHKRHYGFDLAAAHLLETSAAQEPVFLIASFGWEEGAFISEIAMRERHRPAHYLLRGYKVLVRRTSADYEMRLHTPEEIAGYLDSVPVGVVALTVPPGQQMQPFQAALQEMLESKPSVWAKMEIPGLQTEPSEDRILIYRRLVPTGVSHPKIQVDMRKRLGKILEN